MNEMSRRTIRREQEMKFGTQLTADGCRFRLWAPHAATVGLRLDEADATIEMVPQPRGWFEADVAGVGAGTRYRFVLPDGRQVPDPASRRQPEGVDGPSEVVDPLAFEWTDLGWRGRPWEDAVIYELHVGAFTPEGTFRAAIERLDYLAGLGVTAIELMPVAEFPGGRNWGYDGALLFAPDSSYGRPDDLKALVDAAHARQLMVFLDVVYNHFGPKGNYLSLYSPAFTEDYHTPWGMGVNFDAGDGAMMRDFAIANATYWVNEFRFDGLRFDAMNEIRDSSPRHFLQDMAEQVRAATDGRYLHLVAENPDNHAGWMTRRDDLRPTLFTAQWSDDLHHCLHVAVTGESVDYYVDYAGRTDLLGRALAEGLAYQGERASFVGGPRGEPSDFLPPTAFVSCIQNHDQVGNRPHGDRLQRIAPAPAIRAIAAINLLSPHVPMLFMGEEWGSRQPFAYFSDIGADLADAIRTARADAFAGKSWAGPGGPLPDPMDEDTFLAAKLDWAVPAADDAGWLALYRRLLEVRRAEIVPRLLHAEGHSGSWALLGQKGVRVSWVLGDQSQLTLVANLAAQPLAVLDAPAGRTIWQEGDVAGATYGPWSLRLVLEERQA